MKGSEARARVRERPNVRVRRYASLVPEREQTTACTRVRVYAPEYPRASEPPSEKLLGAESPRNCP
jgi:hypothetical protein